MPQNLLNVLAICLCAVLAHMLPAATLLGAYAILGPAHYLTEISWLHDRKYFVSRPWLWVIMVLIALLIMLASPRSPVAHGALYALIGGLVASEFGASFAVTAFAAAISTCAGVVGTMFGWSFVLAIAILVPTLIHVFAFTLMFMVAGASRARRMADWLPIMFLVLAAISFLLLPTADFGQGMFMKTAVQSFSRLFELLSLPGREVAVRLVGFLGFVYAYHYVNWFLKTGLLGWHRVSLWRLVLLVSAWTVVMFAYAQSIVLGLVVSLPLSLGHVLLELPLNVHTARRLWNIPFSRHRMSVPDA